jgi:hypothetical protein
MPFAQATQPIDYFSADRVAQYVLFISALSTAIVAVINAAKAKGTADAAKAVGDANSQQINNVARHAQSIDNKLTDVALATNGGHKGTDQRAGAGTPPAITPAEAFDFNRIE